MTSVQKDASAFDFLHFLQFLRAFLKHVVYLFTGSESTQTGQQAMCFEITEAGTIMSKNMSLKQTGCYLSAQFGSFYNPAWTRK